MYNLLSFKSKNRIDQVVVYNKYPHTHVLASHVVRYYSNRLVRPIYQTVKGLPFNNFYRSPEWALLDGQQFNIHLYCCIRRNFLDSFASVR